MSSWTDIFVPPYKYWQASENEDEQSREPTKREVGGVQVGRRIKVVKGKHQGKIGIVKKVTRKQAKVQFSATDVAYVYKGPHTVKVLGHEDAQDGRPELRQKEVTSDSWINDAAIDSCEMMEGRIQTIFESDCVVPGDLTKFLEQRPTNANLLKDAKMEKDTDQQELNWMEGYDVGQILLIKAESGECSS